MKLAPPQNTLQPLPADVKPAVSQSVQRSATPVDLQTIQNVQSEQTTASQAQQDSGLPVQAITSSASANTAFLWIALVAAILIVGIATWFWRSF